MQMTLTHANAIQMNAKYSGTKQSFLNSDLGGVSEQQQSTKDGTNGFPQLAQAERFIVLLWDT